MLEKENFEIKGMEHLQGWNITDEDMRKIFLAAENGDADAQNEVGYIFYYGIKI